MKNYEVIELAETLSAYVNQLKVLKGAKFGYSLLKNIDLIAKEAKTIQEVQKIEEGFKTFEEKRIELCEKFAEKDETGQVKKNHKTKTSYEYVLDKTNPEFIDGFSKLQEEFKEAIQLQNANFKEYELFLNDENTIELIKFSFDIVPEDISLELLSVIKAFLLD